MLRYSLILLIFSGLAAAQTPTLTAKADPPAGPLRDVVPDTAASVLPPLPALPDGRTTVIGGVIRSVDPVLDEMTVKVFGGQPIKMFFDERTHVYLDGKKMSLEDLRANDRASVETVLDGNDVFAVSIHMLSQTPSGQSQGQVLAFDRSTGELTLRDGVSEQPVTVEVQPGTAISRSGQAHFTSASGGADDLVPGALVTVTFAPDNKGQGLAQQISILATPGSTFTFVGTVSFLNLSAQYMAVTDPRDDKTYKVYFDMTAMPDTRTMHEGQKVMVEARFDGQRYVASAIHNN
jgi:cold shock CspA family protein